LTTSVILCRHQVLLIGRKAAGKRYGVRDTPSVIIKSIAESNVKGSLHSSPQPTMARQPNYIEQRKWHGTHEDFLKKL